ncbi:MAG: hypothetical protein GY774_07175 [Planctomycetes bacterium]|nr:hypothetical protein [Planctomycetota bacterium]|tara:strand:+ start:749 stop:1411 length:663 start_codon:yes stop_codon:yes gene_type:complete
MPKQHTYASAVDQAMENASNVLGMVNLLQTQLKKDMDTIQAYQRQMTPHQMSDMIAEIESSLVVEGKKPLNQMYDNHMVVNNTVIGLFNAEPGNFLTVKQHDDYDINGDHHYDKFVFRFQSTKSDDVLEATVFIMTVHAGFDDKEVVPADRFSERQRVMRNNDDITESQDTLLSSLTQLAIEIKEGNIVIPRMVSDKEYEAANASVNAIAAKLVAANPTK